MDIEHLNKSQIILLTLLVSFVTSIATGIVTVSLMDQAPPAVAQTVNRVIERTVETVVPSKTGQAAATIVTQEKTVVMSESDQISKAVARATPSMVRIYEGSSTDSAFVGFGVVLNASGAVVTDASALGDNADAMLTLSDGTQVRAFVTRRDTDSGLAFLSAATSTDAAAPTWTPATMSGDNPVLGTSIVALSGKTTSRIASGIITSLLSTDAKVPVIDTNISGDVILDGTPIIDTNGDIVGISTGAARATSPSGFIAISVLSSSPSTKK